MHYVVYRKENGAVHKKGSAHPSQMPADDFEFGVLGITEAEYLALKPQITRVVDGALAPAEDAQLLAVAKAEKWAEIKSARDAAENEPFSFAGMVFDGDPISRGRLLAAAQIGMGATWTLQDNSRVELSGAELQKIVSQRAAEIDNYHRVAAGLRVAIEAAVSVERVTAIHW